VTLFSVDAGLTPMAIYGAHVFQLKMQQCWQLPAEVVRYSTALDPSKSSFL